ncbi:MAG: orotidine-5'-phosphate decarboxylase [Dehalococcoidia bacterium]|nr:orotidine-5'-phosphate decarboxylase [Dehalococcoidia bacterium]
MNYFEQLAARSRAVGSLVCVGLDPDAKRTPISEVAARNRAIIEATAPYAACYKPNLAFYEQFGIEGWRALEATLAAIPGDIPVIADGKRGDIGSTAEAYARALFETWGVHAATLNPYMGRDTVEPYLAYKGRGLYLLCRTSNPGAADFQYLQVDGVPLYEQVARTVTSWSPDIGLVVGATAPDELRRIREIVPGASLLVPGVGAQGGSPAEVIAAAGAEPGTLVVNASRSIYYASDGADFPEAAARAAQALRDELAGAAASIHA